MTRQQLLLIELCVLTNWLALLFFAAIHYFLDVGVLSSFALGIAVLINLPIAICYGLFVAKFNPPLAQYFSNGFTNRKPVPVVSYKSEVSGRPEVS